jgi:hypothetical protein
LRNEVYSVSDADQRARQDILDSLLSAQQAVTQAGIHLRPRPRCGFHQRHSPLQSGLGCFEQLAEHL